MSDTDIYKNRERMPYANKRPQRSSRRRRSKSQRSFDDHSRKRRSKNSGFRRLLHLYRKKENEKAIWTTILIVTVVILVLLAIWQFWIREMQIRSQEKENQYIEYQRDIPGAAKSASPSE